MADVFFQDWTTLQRTLIVGVLAYASLVLILRVAGRRTLSKMNAFDFVVTIALGSTLATILLNREVALAEGALAFAVLVGLQYAITWTSVRVRWVRRLVTGEPVLLLYHGAYLHDALRRVRVTEDEVLAALRSEGVGEVSQVGAVVLETDGSFSVVRNVAAGASALADMQVPHSGERQ
ncbi:MAG: DUF421 domain-containing protein [Xanthomonadaceae bacterium]|nr:DUF421 domain-containing protein [Xanthomonadaceae bacterium]